MSVRARSNIIIELFFLAVLAALVHSLSFFLHIGKRKINSNCKLVHPVKKNRLYISVLQSSDAILNPNITAIFPLHYAQSRSVYSCNKGIKTSLLLRGSGLPNVMEFRQSGALVQ